MPFSLNAFHGNRVGLSGDLSNKPEAMRISQMGQHTHPKQVFGGDSNGTKKTILPFPVQHNKTVNGRPPVVV